MNNYIFEAFGEYKIYIAFFLAILFFMKSPSISFFTGLILKLFRIKYSDKEYVEYDEMLYNQQLFRLKNGVRVASADDAKLISKALSEGIIERSTLRFTGWFGAVGVKRTMRLESVSTTFFGVLFIFTACSILYDAPYMKAGYVTYNVSDTEKFIFLNTGYMIKRIITPGTNFNVLKSSKMKNPFSILKMHVFISQLMTLTYEQNCRMQLNLNQLEKKFSLRS